MGSGKVCVSDGRRVELGSERLEHNRVILVGDGGDRSLMHSAVFAFGYTAVTGGEAAGITAAAKSTDGFVGSTLLVVDETALGSDGYPTVSLTQSRLRTIRRLETEWARDHQCKHLRVDYIAVPRSTEVAPGAATIPVTRVRGITELVGERYTELLEAERRTA